MSLRSFTSSVFIITRVLASGVRLFATAIPVHLITGLDYSTSILLIGVLRCSTRTWADSRPLCDGCRQMFIYLGRRGIDDTDIASPAERWSDVVSYATAGGINKFEIFNPNWGNGFGLPLCSLYAACGLLAAHF